MYLISILCFLANESKIANVVGGISSGRFLKQGRAIGKTLIRRYKSCLKLPSWIFASKFWFVADIIRTSTLCVSAPPTLSISPLRKITNSTEWLKFRRMVGLFTFSYASIHMLSYVGLDYRFDIDPLINDVLKKKFIFIGFSAWLLLTVLALTSSDTMVRMLKSNWKKLHRLVYVIAIFGSLHFIWLSKTIFFKPLIYTIIILILLSFRIKLKKNA